jgi:P27 family predicted phage terminase small subunit
MARPRQPINLLEFKGKKHLTKQEIEERKSQEIKAPNNKVKAPTYLPRDLKREFKKISDELIEIGIMSNLDIDALARFLLARKMYLQITNILLETDPVLEITDIKKDDDGKVIKTDTYTITNEVYTEQLINQDKLFKQCRQAASDLGLTITSRCKLVVPTKQEDQPKTTAEKKFGSKL